MSFKSTALKLIAFTTLGMGLGSCSKQTDAEIKQAKIQSKQDFETDRLAQLVAMELLADTAKNQAAVLVKHMEACDCKIEVTRYDTGYSDVQVEKAPTDSTNNSTGTSQQLQINF